MLRQVPRDLVAPPPTIAATGVVGAQHRVVETPRALRNVLRGYLEGVQPIASRRDIVLARHRRGVPNATRRFTHVRMTFTANVTNTHISAGDVAGIKVSGTFIWV